MTKRELLAQEGGLQVGGRSRARIRLVARRSIPLGYHLPGNLRNAPIGIHHHLEQMDERLCRSRFVLAPLFRYGLVHLFV
jgi:hypothetical protein